MSADRTVVGIGELLWDVFDGQERAGECWPALISYSRFGGMTQ